LMTATNSFDTLISIRALSKKKRGTAGELKQKSENATSQSPKGMRVTETRRRMARRQTTW
jgi:hypothetical protein